MSRHFRAELDDDRPPYGTKSIQKRAARWAVLTYRLVRRSEVSSV